MFIKNDAVANWRDLQEKVAQLFEEMDYKIESPRKVALAGRGKKEVDVYVKDQLASVNQIYLVECKHWGKNVPQDVAHSFKTVMEESGANTGFIISKVGFQSGARKAVRYTNIHLLTFEELQRKYGKEWFRKQKSRLDALVDQLRETHRLHFDQFNTLPIHNNMFFHTEKLYKRLAYFNKQNVNLVILASAFCPKSYLGPMPPPSMNPFDPLTDEPHRFKTVRQYFQDMIKAVQACIDDFESLKTEAQRSFEALPDDEQSDLMDRSLRAGLEELPVRVLKNYLSEPQYRSIFRKLAKRTAPRMPTSP